MDDIAFSEIMAQIESAIRDADYDPYEQLVGYLQTGQDYYITRRANARDLIKTVELCRLNQYVHESLCRNGDMNRNVVAPKIACWSKD